MSRDFDELLHVVCLRSGGSWNRSGKVVARTERSSGPETIRRGFCGVPRIAGAGFAVAGRGQPPRSGNHSRIAVDKRHRDVQVIYEASGPQQLNSPWSMIRWPGQTTLRRSTPRVRAQPPPGSNVEPQDFVRAFTMPYGQQGLDDVASQRPVVVTGANMIWASAVVSQAAHTSRVELARTAAAVP